MSVAAFPSLRPASRTWTPGTQRSTTYTAVSGFESRVLHGNKAVSSQLSLSFSNLLEGEVDLITAHYLLAKGTYETFSLPAAVFAGMASTAQIDPSGFAWRYSAAPTVSYVSPGIASVTVALVSVAL